MNYDLWHLDRWLALPADVRREAAREAWCSVGAQQGYCSVCHLGFRGLAPFDQGFRDGVDGCSHPELVREGVLRLLERRTVSGVVALRVGHPDTREVAA